ncbi:microsomal glutathione S-transferase 1-like [Cylas formicarius]|uniref:microsomal glutathione S-transferase 1-like n=1 Tax=Cylas formicarius TaxID=197179 RepID=UPI0029588C7D|nr:microsomal glutathione S-transferase 1-like [Cylas formicarius]
MSEKLIKFEIDGELLETFFFYSAILILKTLLMVPLVGFSRIYFRAPVNAEDARTVNGLLSLTKGKAVEVKQHDSVERNRRAHLNDLENIPFFIIASFLYILLTNPSVFWTVWLIRLYTLSRIIYSIVYTRLKSSVRILVYQFGFLILFYFTVSVLLHFVK